MTLRLSHFCAGYGRVPVVRDISLEIGKGRIVGLLGANGAGKTTLMRAVSGLATLQGGSIEFAGNDVTRLSSAQLVERGTRGWAGRADDDLVELGERLFVQSIGGTLFHDAWRLIKAHQRRGHTVVIATSATRFQVGPLVRQLGVEHLLCTELEAEDGILTGRLAGRTLWGPGKIAAVQAFAAGHGIDLAASHGYANGDEDVPFLQAVGHPHPVNPQKRLAREASARGWPVLHFKRRSRRLDPAPALRTAAMYGSLLTASGTGLTMGLLNRDRRRGVDVATSVFGDLAGAVGDIKIEVVGQQHLWSHRPAVFFINHQSALIDLLVTSRLPYMAAVRRVGVGSSRRDRLLKCSTGQPRAEATSANRFCGLTG